MTDKPAAKKKKPAPKSRSGKSDEALKEAVLKLALKDAAFDGFTDGVLAKAGKAEGLDKAAMSRLFPDGPLSLIEFYSTSLDRAMEAKLAELDLSKRKIRDRIKTAILTRLELLAPNKEAARRVAAMLSLPMHAGLAAKLMYRTVDGMWRAAGDTSTDFNFYTKRGILAGVYGSVLVRWFNDTSADESETRAFLDARIENVMQFEKFKAKTREALSQFPAFAAWAKPKTK
jgi:ubiquinone biosynthesis protein COQ9